ncbi:MAG: hypothetical protein JSW25_09075 [Thermoplasmata archaeon]|nr:MAG: hypothetical protein JSW25_09075 [Thermoplasmata archaeon]
MLGRSQLLLLGGGDVGALRSALDLDAIEAWVEAGGRLVATCAGAYMLRRWLGVGIANTSDEPPANATRRAWSHCEEGVAIHPVRGPVSLRSMGGATFTSPLFGGPVFHEPVGKGAVVEARYDGVTRGAEWLMADRPQMLEGTPAVVSRQKGDGLVVLAGPHIEHPDHPAAHLWLAGVLGWEPGDPPPTQAPSMASTDPGGEDVVRRLASVRRRAATLADRSWLSGEKTWNGERLAGFADSLIPRARTLAHWGWGPRGREGELRSLLEAATDQLGRPSPESWDVGWGALSEVASMLMEAYFANRRGGMAPPARTIKRPPRLAPEGGWGAPTVEVAGGKEVRR